MKNVYSRHAVLGIIGTTKMVSITVLVLLLNLLFVEDIFGGAFDNRIIGIRGFAMGNALTGIADDASAVHYNPAGLVFNEHTWDAEVYSYFAFTGYTYTANSRDDTSDEILVIPGAFISRKYDQWALGVGFYTPYGGGGTAYENFQSFQSDLEFAGGCAALTPALAYKLRPNLSVGAGVSLYVGTMQSKITQEVAPDVFAEVESEYNGLAGYGGNIGLLYKPRKDLGLGMSIKSLVPVKMDGTVKIAGQENDAEVEFTLPFYFTLGAEYQPHPKLTLGISTSYMLWEDMDSITFTIAGIETETQTFYKNSWALGLGMEYALNNTLDMRAGLTYIQGATKDEGLNPTTNDVDVLMPSMGVAYTITKSIEMNIVGSYCNGFEKEYQSQTFDQDHLTMLAGINILL